MPNIMSNDYFHNIASSKLDSYVHLKKSFAWIETVVALYNEQYDELK